MENILYLHTLVASNQEIIERYNPQLRAKKTKIKLDSKKLNLKSYFLISRNV
jgi:hypothetical protein